MTPKEFEGMISQLTERIEKGKKLFNEIKESKLKWYTQGGIDALTAFRDSLKERYEQLKTQNP